MSDDATESERPDFEERLRQVKRRQQERARQAAASGGVDPAEEPAETSLGMTSGRRSQSRDNTRIVPDSGPLDDLWMKLALGMGGCSLVFILLLAAVLYRHNTQLGQLQESLTYLEEQLDRLAMPDAGMTGSEGSSQLLQRVDALERQDDRLQAFERRLEALENEREHLPTGQLGVSSKSVPTKTASPGARSKIDVASLANQSGAKWYIVLSSFRQRDEAEKFHRKLGKMGLKSQIQPVSVKGRQWYRVRLGPYATASIAKTRGEQMKARLGLDSVWVSR